MKLRRVREPGGFKPGCYESRDGRWLFGKADYNQCWYVYELPSREEATYQGFPTRWEAVEYTKKHLANKVPDPLPCPCCGESRPYFSDGKSESHGIYVGVTGSMEAGVKCRTCGLAMELSWPDKYPDGIDDPDDLYVYTALRAVEAWNRRKS